MFTDDDRRALFDALEATLGHVPASILMGHLPPVGWADVATKADVAASSGQLRGEMAELRGEMAQLRGEVHAVLPKLIAANIASMIGVAGLVLAAGALLR